MLRCRGGCHIERRNCWRRYLVTASTLYPRIARFQRISLAYCFILITPITPITLIIIIIIIILICDHSTPPAPITALNRIKSVTGSSGVRVRFSPRRIRSLQPRRASRI